jgi:Mor family transcriptional regulator
MFAVMPKDAEGNNIGLLDEKFRNMDTAQVYKILKQEQEDNRRRPR